MPGCPPSCLANGIFSSEHCLAMGLVLCLQINQENTASRQNWYYSAVQGAAVGAPCQEGERHRGVTGYRRFVPCSAWHRLSQHKGTQIVMANLAERIRI